jgi:hypothetical protein
MALTKKTYVYNIFDKDTKVGQFESEKWLSDYDVKMKVLRIELDSKLEYFHLRWVVSIEERPLTFDEVLEMREDTPTLPEIEYTEEQIKILEYYYEEQRRQQIG